MLQSASTLQNYVQPNLKTLGKAFEKEALNRRCMIFNYKPTMILKMKILYELSLVAGLEFEAVKQSTLVIH